MKMLASVLVTLLFWALLLPVAQADSDPLVVYSGRSDVFVRPAMARFTEKTGIEVVVHTGSATELVNKLRLEGRRTDADLFLSNDAGSLQLGASHDLFLTLPEALLGDIPDNYRDEGGQWVGLSARARVLVVNTQAEDLPEIDSVFDLAREELNGRIAITNSANESFVAGVTVYLEAAGDEATRAWLEGLRRNAGGSTYARHRQVVNDVAAGRRAVGLVNHYYVSRHLDDAPDAPLRMIVPDQGEGQIGVAWNVSGVGVSRHSSRPEAALKLVEFLVSEEGQAIFAGVNREYPVRSGVSLAEGLPAAGEMRVADVPMSLLGPNRGRAVDLIEAVGMP